WFSNQGNGPAHPLQGQPWDQPTEVCGPPRRRRGGGAGGFTPLAGTPASNGEMALEGLRNVLQRIATEWRPASPNEGFEIVRRRLFEPIPNDETGAHRDAVVRSFKEMYALNKNEVPAETREAAYVDKLTASFPSTRSCSSASTTTGAPSPTFNAPAACCACSPKPSRSSETAAART
ncbi:MAG: hypothetical protein ACK6BC_15755, partial [Cyanobacteriota bacterium]